VLGRARLVNPVIVYLIYAYLCWTYRHVLRANKGGTLPLEITTRLLTVYVSVCVRITTCRSASHVWVLLLAPYAPWKNITWVTFLSRCITRRGTLGKSQNMLLFA